MSFARKATRSKPAVVEEPLDEFSEAASSVAAPSTPASASVSSASARAASPKSAAVSMTPGKRQALESAFKQIESAYGKGSVMKLGARLNQEIALNIPVIPTGSIALDAALGIGGVPKGRVVEVYGPESSGKTTLALHIIAEAQKQGGTCCFIDAEHALDAVYARRLGVDIDNLIVSQPDSGEQALEICETLVRSGSMDLIVIDSVAALVPKAEIEGEMGDAHMALQARLMSQALRKLTAHLSKQHTTLLFINQIRHKVGVMFGSPEVTSGGNALKFYASMRMEIRRVGPVKNGDEIIGNHVRVKVAKNKLAPPFREAEFDIEFGRGISRLSEVVDLGATHNVLTKSGSWFSYGDVQLAQGREKTKQYLQEHPAMLKEVEAKVRAAMAAASAGASASADLSSSVAVTEAAEADDQIPASVLVAAGVEAMEDVKDEAPKL